MLKISLNEQLTDIISNDGSNPLTTQHPIQGSTEEVLVYVFNERVAEESTNKRYENVTIDSVDTTGSDESSWVEFAEDSGGNPTTYSAGPLNIGDIDTLDTPVPVWVRITTPQVEETTNKDDIKLQLTGTEFAV